MERGEGDWKRDCRYKENVKGKTRLEIVYVYMIKRWLSFNRICKTN